MKDFILPFIFLVSAVLFFAGDPIFMIAWLAITLPTYSMLKSDISIDKSKNITLSNKIGTFFMLFSYIGILYFIISMFFIKNIHPNKVKFLKIIFVLNIISGLVIGYYIVSKNISSNEITINK
jgi:hypothetical protein